MFNIGPYGGSNRIKLEKSSYLKAWLLVACLFGMIVLYIFEFRQFDLILNPKLLLLYAVFHGVAIGILLGKIYSKDVSESYERMRIYVVFIGLGIAFMPLIINLANRLLDFNTPEIKEVSLERVEAYVSEKYGILKGENVKVAGYKIVVVMDQRALNLKSKHNPFPNNKSGDMVQVSIYQGLFGLKYVGLKDH